MQVKGGCDGMDGKGWIDRMAKKKREKGKLKHTTLRADVSMMKCCVLACVVAHIMPS